MQELVQNLSHLMNYRKQVPQEGFVELMDKILAGLPGIGWELGPGLIDPNVDLLSLSVMHAPALLDDADFVAAFPLRGDGWVVDLGVPPRDWEIYFEATLDGQRYPVEGAEWRWQMSLREGKASLMLAVPAGRLAGLGAEALQEFAEIIVVGELGELNVLRNLASIEVVRMDAFDDAWQPMESLRAGFALRFPSCAYADWLGASRL